MENIPTNWVLYLGYSTILHRCFFFACIHPAFDVDSFALSWKTSTGSMVYCFIPLGNLPSNKMGLGKQ